MPRKPVARVGDSGSHGGGIITGSSKIPVNNRALARVGDIYDCPTHGPNPIGTGASHVLAKESSLRMSGHERPVEQL